jgi:hypothetical protein
VAPNTTTTTTTTTTSTTVAPNTTTTTVAPLSGPGGLRGSVWIDFDLDDVWDADEPALPGIQVEAIQQGVQNPVPVALTTDANGLFQAANLAPGTWKVVARLSSDSLVPSWDTDGGVDWEVLVVVPSGGEGVADFAAHGAADVCVSNAPSDVGTLDYSWEGQDNSLGSSDDVDFSHQLATSNSCVENVPAGDYEVEVLAQDGRRIRRLSVDVEPGVQRLDPVSGRVTLLALPDTGRDPSGTQDWARWLILGGVATLWASRRRLGSARRGTAR